MTDTVNIPGARPRGGPADHPPRLTVLVPTRNEADNVQPLLDRLGPAVAPLTAEILVLDDSDDDTPSAVLDQAPRCPVPVRLLHRTPAERRGGGGGAGGGRGPGARRGRGLGGGGGPPPP